MGTSCSFPFVVSVQGSRREKNRSLLDVNEDFSHKHNAAIFVLPKPKKSYRAESARLAKPKKAEFTRVNEHFEGEHNAAIFVLQNLKNRIGRRVQGSRREKNRSLLDVNEDFSHKHNAAIFVLYGFYLSEFIRILAFTNAIARIRLISISLSAWWGF